jgi:hypothetical protein
MLAHISIYLGFIEKAEKLMNYPEITSSDMAYFKFGNIDIASHNPVHNGKYDPRLFDALANHVRKIFILHNEPISLQKVHSKASADLTNDLDFLLLDQVYNKIRVYLESNMNSVTQFSFSLPGSAVEKTSVFELLNNYFAATSQHSKPKAQSVIHELNVLTFGALPEMARVMIIDLIKLVFEYATTLRKMISK